MRLAKFLSLSAIIPSFGLGFFGAESAHALQPLAEFLAAAETQNFDARELRAVTVQREWERSASLGRLLPSLTARGTYTLNQFEAAVVLPGTTEEIVITPQHQLDGMLQLDVPLVDLSSYHRYRQAKHVENAAREQEGLTQAQVESAVARSYFLLVGSVAMVEAAERSLAAATENLKFVETRAALGAATDFDVQRARANVEQSRQELADAGLGRDLAVRSLETLTGLTPTAVTSYPGVSLEPGPPLGAWLNGEKTPADRVQDELLKAAESGVKAGRAALLPTLSASAQERFTNATGFIGQPAIFTLQAVLGWRLDWGTYAQSKAQGAALEAQTIRQERTQRGTEDAIFEAYQRVQTGIAKSRSTQAQADAAQKASELASERYQAGAATQLDVTQAQRDAFVANVAKVRADADLAFARVQLVALTGRPLDPESLFLTEPGSEAPSPAASDAPVSDTSGLAPEAAPDAAAPSAP